MAERVEEVDFPLLRGRPLTEVERLRSEVIDAKQQAAMARHVSACLRETIAQLEAELAKLRGTKP